MRNKKGNLGMAAYDLVLIESGRQDSNLRPSAPKAIGQKLNNPSFLKEILKYKLLIFYFEK